MTQLNRSDKRDDYIRKLRDVEHSLGSAKTIGFILTQSEQDRARFFKLQTAISNFKSSLERDKLDAIALQLEQLEKDFSQGISNLESALDRLNNTTEILSKIDIVVGILTRIFI